MADRKPTYDELQDENEDLMDENEDLRSKLDEIQGVLEEDEDEGVAGPACGTGWGKEAHEVTDRRLRQRAVECRPAGKHCLWCGATVRLMVAHIDGEESNGRQENLGPTCRSCNAKVAHVMKRVGLGRRTRQYNPRSDGAQTLSQWMAAVMSMKGESDQMGVSDAVAMIHATPASDRSRFAREIWDLRQEHRTASRDRSEYDELPY